MWKATLRPITGLLPTHQLQGDVKWRIYLDPLCLSFFYTWLEQPCKQTQNGRNMYDIYIYTHITLCIYIYVYHTLQSLQVGASVQIPSHFFTELRRGARQWFRSWCNLQNVVQRRESPCAPAKYVNLNILYTYIYIYTHIYIHIHTYYIFHFLTMFGGRNIHVPQLF